MQTTVAYVANDFYHSCVLERDTMYIKRCSLRWESIIIIYRKKIVV